MTRSRCWCHLFIRARILYAHYFPSLCLCFVRVLCMQFSCKIRKDPKTLNANRTYIVVYMDKNLYTSVFWFIMLVSTVCGTSVLHPSVFKLQLILGDAAFQDRMFESIFDFICSNPFAIVPSFYPNITLYGLVVSWWWVVGLKWFSSITSLRVPIGSSIWNNYLPNLDLFFQIGNGYKISPIFFSWIEILSLSAL